MAEAKGEIDQRNQCHCLERSLTQCCLSCAWVAMKEEADTGTQHGCPWDLSHAGKYLLTLADGEFLWKIQDEQPSRYFYSD